jgi:m7GpppX diphosphatase
MMLTKQHKGYMDKQQFECTVMEDGNMYKLSLNKPSCILHTVKLLCEEMKNERYSKYHVKAELVGSMIVTKNPNKYDTKNIRTKRHLTKETYEEYLIKLQSVHHTNYKWVYNIIDGTSEQDRILYRDEQMILIPTFTWDKTDMEKFHLLAITTDKSLHTIRDLTGDHIQHVQHMYQTSVATIEKIFGIPSSRIKAYIHYPPSAWHLHIHFCTLDNVTASSSIEYSHLVDTVVSNLQLCPTYYKNVMVTHMDC